VCECGCVRVCVRKWMGVCGCACACQLLLLIMVLSDNQVIKTECDIQYSHVGDF
jgi:hypothetical protein